MSGILVAAEPNRLRSGQKIYTWLFWFFIFVVIFTPLVFDLDVFYARDELATWSWSDEFTLAVWAGDPAGTLTRSNYPGIPLFWAQTLFLTVKYTFPALFPQTMIPLDRLDDEDSLPFLAERRLASALLAGVLIAGLAGLVSRLFGRAAALLAAVFVGLDPFTLSEARLFRPEIISGLFAGLSVLAYLLYFREHRQRWLLLSGLMAGLGVSSKASAGLLVPYIWLLLLLDFLFGPPGSPPGEGSRWRLKFRQMITNGLAWGGSAIAAFWITWPAMWVEPGEAITYIFLRGLSQVSADSVWHGPVFFWGQLFLNEDPGLFFYPVVFAFRTTPLTWLGLGCAFLMVLLLWRIRPEGPLLWGRPWVPMALLLLAGYIVLVCLELSASLSKVDRYLLLVFPVLNVLGAVGLAALVFRLRSAAGRGAAVRWGAVMLAVLGLQLWVMLPAHPYFFTYWNPLVGGGRAAMATLPLGSGEGVDLAMDYLNARPGAAQATLVCGGSQPWCSRKFVGETFRYATYFNGQWVTADYASFYISHLQRQTYPPEIVDFFMRQPPLYRVELDGATYMWVYGVPPIAHFTGPENDLAGLGRLLGYNLDPIVRPGEQSSRVEAGQAAALTLWWTNWGAGVDNLVLRLTDEVGYEWARARVAPEADYAGIRPEQRVIVVGTAAVTVPPDAPPGRYFLRLGVTAPGENRLLGEFDMPGEAGQILVEPGPVFSDPASLPIARPVNRRLAPDVTLLGYTPPEGVLTARVPTWLALTWQAGDRPADYQVLLRLRDKTGREVYRWQGAPTGGRYTPPHWRAGEIVRDVWPLLVAAATPIGRYRLELSLLDAGGVPLGAGPVYLGELEVWPQPVSYETPAMQNRLQARFDNSLTLLGYDLYFDLGAAGGGRLAPVFYWRSETGLERAFDLVLALRPAAGDQVVREWRVPLGVPQVKDFWKAGEVITTLYELEAATTPGAAYHLDLTLVDQADGRPVPVEREDGTTAGFIRLENIQDRIVVRTAGH